MNLDPKKLLISARYYATLPFRKAAMTTLCKDGMAPMMILFYHRVADDSPNDWTISNSLFKRQIDWARSRFEMVSLAEVQRRMHRGKNVRPTVSVTFDDGYQENCDQALPYLIEHNIPTTYFVSLDNIERNQPFPHDLKAGYPLCPNTPAQIRQLAVAGIDIGAHTRSHPDLGKIHDLAELRKEIVEPKQALEAMIETPVNYFAFPFGKQENMHTTAVQLIHEAGYDGFCSAYGNYNHPNDHPFHLQRFHADPEMARFKNWLTYDSRKTRLTQVPNLQLPSKPQSDTQCMPAFTEQEHEFVSS